MSAFSAVGIKFYDSCQRSQMFAQILCDIIITASNKDITKSCDLFLWQSTANFELCQQKFTIHAWLKNHSWIYWFHGDRIWNSYWPVNPRSQWLEGLLVDSDFVPTPWNNFIVIKLFILGYVLESQEIFLFDIFFHNYLYCVFIVIDDFLCQILD